MAVPPPDRPAQGRRRPRGRRAGGEDTRELIVAAARAEFAEHGYAGASVRAIARRAGVDPALVRYWFEGGKAELFSTSIVDRRVNPKRIAEGLAGGPRDGLGNRIVAAVLGVWEAPGGPERLRMVFGALLGAGQADAVRDYLTQEVFARIGTALEGPDVALRVNLVASHLAGLMVARHVLRLEPLASTPFEEVVRRVGPVVQRYVDGDTREPDGDTREPDGDTREPDGDTREPDGARGAGSD